jgi:gas vesicle protein
MPPEGEAEDPDLAKTQDKQATRVEIGKFVFILVLYSVLAGVWFFAGPIAEWSGRAMLGWRDEQVWVNLSDDSLLIRLKADSLRVALLKDALEPQLPDSAWARVVLDTIWRGSRADSMQIMRIPPSRIQRLESGIVLFAVIGVLAFLALAGYMRERREERWAWVTIFVLVGILIVLGAEVIEWLEAGSERQIGVVEMLEGVLLASAVGGITYVLINVGGSVRNLVEGHAQVYRSRREALESCRDQLINEMQEYAVQDQRSNSHEQNLHPAVRVNTIKEYQDQIRQLEDDILQALQDETSENKKEISEALMQFSIHRRLFHVLMAMGLAVGVAVLGSSVGVDAFKDRTGDDALIILGVSFLVGMFPRVFETFLKGIADRLVGEEASRKPLKGGAPTTQRRASESPTRSPPVRPASESQGQVTSAEADESAERRKEPQGGFDVQLPDQPGQEN